MKIFCYKRCTSTNDSLVSILCLNGWYTAMTLSQSKDFKTLTGAKNWLAKRGYTKIIDIT